MNHKKVALVMGSITDAHIVAPAREILKQFDVPFFCKVVSAHRDPKGMVSFADQIHKQDVAVIIAAAGGAAHLPGMLAALTIVPVIGIPVKSSNSILGIDSLLSIVQMPAEVPVATVGIDGAKNAALLAVRILAVNNNNLMESLINFQQTHVVKVGQQNIEFQNQISDESKHN